MKKTGNKGFTLIEVLVVIGIIAILAAIVVIAVNPARQFAQANDSQRWSNVNAILNAVHQYAVDNRGALPAGIPTTTPVEICKTGAASCVNLIDLATLVPTYIVSIPTDPQATTALAGFDATNGTGYKIQVVGGNASSTGRVLVTAPRAQVSATPIEVTR